jgi:transposase-like protein
MLLLASSVCGLFKWRQFEPEVILLAVGWYLRFSLSYRDMEELLVEQRCFNARWLHRLKQCVHNGLIGAQTAKGEAEQ